MTHSPQSQYLSRVSTDTLIRIAQADPSNDTLAMNEIVRRFEPLARRLAVAVEGADHHLREDLANAARMGLVRAVRRHKDGTLGFPAFAKIHMRGAVLREFEKWIVPETVDSAMVEDLQSTAMSLDHAEHVLDEIAPWGAGKVATAVSKLDPMQRVLLELRYIDDAPVKEIAIIMGTSGPAVSQRIATVQRAVFRDLAA